MNAPLLPRIEQLTDEPLASPIGEVLVASGRLDRANLVAIENHRLLHSSRFGEAAVQLGFVTEADVRAALALQLQSPTLHPGIANLPSELICAVDPAHPTSEAICRLRTALLLRHRGTRGPMMLAIVGVHRGEGRTFLASNLAIAFAQTGMTTVLVDADLRHGRLHDLFRTPLDHSLARVLIGRSEIAEALPMASHDTLTVLPAGSAPNPQELLSMGRFSRTMHVLGQRHEVVIVDTPAWDTSSDAQLVAAATGMALFTSRLGVTDQRRAKDMIASLRQCGVSMVAASMGTE